METPAIKTKLTASYVLYVDQYWLKSGAPDIPWQGKVTPGDWIAWIVDSSGKEDRIAAWYILGSGNLDDGMKLNAHFWAGATLKSSGTPTVDPANWTTV
jgi:hypothetical protein